MGILDFIFGKDKIESVSRIKERPIPRIKILPETEEFEYGRWLFPNGTIKRITEWENDHMGEINDEGGIDEYFLQFSDKSIMVKRPNLARRRKYYKKGKNVYK